ncbi:MAG: hypothetical protein ABI596_15055 [Pyrinomonadaceae bacterium]
MSSNNPAGNATPSGNVVKTTGQKKQCKPFIFEVMVYSPEAGYKAQVVVERGCTATNDSVWKFVFDLYKKQATGSGFDQLVHVSYRALTKEENIAVVGMIDGLTDAQADALPDLHEAAKEFHDDPTPETKAAVLQKANGVVTAEN